MLDVSLRVRSRASLPSAAAIALAAGMIAPCALAQTPMRVKDINPVVPVSGASPSTPVKVGSGASAVAFFTVDDGTHGAELWVTDATTAGTHIVKDINTSSAGASSSPTSL